MKSRFLNYDNFLSESVNLTPEQLEIQDKKIEKWAKTTGYSYELKKYRDTETTLHINTPMGRCSFGYEDTLKKGGTNSYTFGREYSRLEKKTWYMKFRGHYSRYDVNSLQKKASFPIFVQSFNIMCFAENVFLRIFKFLEIMNHPIEKKESQQINWSPTSAINFDTSVYISSQVRLDFRADGTQTTFHIFEVNDKNSTFTDGKTVLLLKLLFRSYLKSDDITELDKKMIKLLETLQDSDLTSFMETLEKVGPERMIHENRGKIGSGKFGF